MSWVALVVLVLSHVFMFALGVAAYHCLRWINMRPLVQRPPMSEAKMAQIAEKMAREQVNAERFAWPGRFNQPVQPQQPQEQVEESFAPSKR